MERNIAVEEKVYRILLLTNRDSDNTGDQVIEACDLSLLKAVMKNLGVEHYTIESRAAAIVTQKYVETKNPELLQEARKAVQKADLVVFGGAPLLNYERQIFYERTAVTLDLVREYKKTAIFSAIGIEHYNEEDERCQRVKKAVNYECVKQFTTRDHLELLKKFKEREDLVIGLVSDPAVMSGKVFENFIEKRESGKKKKIGIFVLRAYGFLDNGFSISKKDAAIFWKGLGEELEKRGYDYEYLSNGHFGDEAFLDYLIRTYGVDEKKCVFNMNLPEILVNRISSYDAVVTCRLHPSIVSFALNIPAVGLIWNRKVSGFYDSVGYGDRALFMEGLTPELLADKLEQVMEQGVKHDEAYLNTVYESLFYGIREGLGLEENTANPYTYEELLQNMPVFQGTSPKEQQEKLKRKYRRAYRNYNRYQDQVKEKSQEIKRLKEEIRQLKGQVKVLTEESEARHPLVYLLGRKTKAAAKAVLRLGESSK